MARARCTGRAGDGRLCDPQRHVPDIAATDGTAPGHVGPVGIDRQPVIARRIAVAVGRAAVNVGRAALIVGWPAIVVR